MKAIEFYRIGKLPPDLARIAQDTPYFLFSLPSEAYADNPVQLLQSIKNWPTGRVWMTQFSLIDGVWVPWDEVYKRSGKGTQQFPNKVLVEIWGNYGDDGHTNMLIAGHATIECNPAERFTQKAIENATYNLVWNSES